MKRPLLILVIMMTSVLISAQVIHVPGDYGTIQDGINAADKGDTVLVAEGTYYENVNFRGKAITLASNYILTPDTNYINNTIIDGGSPIYADSAAVITLCNDEDSSTIICGFTITHGSGNTTNVPGIGELVFGGGICCDHAGAKIINNKIIFNTAFSQNASVGAGIGTNESGEIWCIVRNNTIKYNECSAHDLFVGGGGISINGKGVIDNNIISYNNSNTQDGFVYGAGIFIEALNMSPADSVIIKHNLVSYNLSEGYGPEVLGGAIMIWYARPIIHDNVITNNHVLGDGNVCFGAGMSICRTFGELDIYNNYIADNTISDYVLHVGVGVHLWDPDQHVTIIDNDFVNNTASSTFEGLGGGICLLDTDDKLLTLRKNKFINNEAKAGGGLFIRDAENAIIENNLFSGNSSFRGGGINLYQEDPPVNAVLTVFNNTFYNNYAADRGGGFRSYGENGRTILLINNLFWENTASVIPQSNSISNGSTFDTLKVYYSNISSNEISGFWSGEGNIHEDPLFIDDLCHLDCWTPSPCWNTGIDAFSWGGSVYYAPLDDLDGESRPKDSLFDIGAYEEELCVQIQEGKNESSFGLMINPNPSSGATHLRYSILDTRYLIFELYSSVGVKVKTLYRGQHQSGDHEMDIDLNDLPNGIYFIRLQAGEMVETAKVILIK